MDRTLLYDYRDRKAKLFIQNSGKKLHCTHALWYVDFTYISKPYENGFLDKCVKYSDTADPHRNLKLAANS